MRPAEDRSVRKNLLGRKKQSVAHIRRYLREGDVSEVQQPMLYMSLDFSIYTIIIA
jgi:hypothetical protein